MGVAALYIRGRYGRWMADLLQMATYQSAIAPQFLGGRAISHGKHSLMSTLDGINNDQQLYQPGIALRVRNEEKAVTGDIIADIETK